MTNDYSNQSIVNNLYSLLGILELDKSYQIYQDAIALQKREFNIWQQQLVLPISSCLKIRDC